MAIQWFPGHMAKARRQIEERLPVIDIVLELLDARIPLSSRNPMLDEILQQKPRVVLLNKADLADPVVTERWRHFFQQHENRSALPVDTRKSKISASIVKLAQEAAEGAKRLRKRPGMQKRSVRALIVGIPNVGKSSLINRLANRSATRTGDRPGVTQGQQWINVGKSFQLLDTPGILWPKWEDPQVGLHLAASGAIKDQLLPTEEVAFDLLEKTIIRYPGLLEKRYYLHDTDTSKFTQIEWLEAIGRRRGCLRAGDLVDVQQTSGLLLREFRAGLWGRMTLQWPEDVSNFKIR